MSRLLNIDNKLKKFTIGSISPSFSTEINVNILVAGNVRHFTNMSSFALTIKSNRLLDLGGSGDCFFLAVNAAMSYLTGSYGNPTAFNAASIYDLLQLPYYTYIEDDHIAKFVGIYPFSIVIIREYQGTCHFTQYGDAEDLIYLFNDFPRHYMLFDQVYFKGAFLTYDSIPVYQIISDEKKVLQEAILPPVMQSNIQITDDPNTCIVEDLDLKFLYHYVDSRYTIRKEGKALTANDSKAYYKFATIYLKRFSYLC